MEEFLYPEDVLKSVKIADWPHATFNPAITIQRPGEDLNIRPLKRTDFSRGGYNYCCISCIKLFSINKLRCYFYSVGFPKILSQMTSVGEVTEDQFIGTSK